MRRDLAMLRRLEKIEKEIGYCEIKLEKEQRLLAQSRFLQMHDRTLRDLLEQYTETYGQQWPTEGDTNGLGGIALSRVQRELTVDRKTSVSDKYRARFCAVGAVTFFREEQRALATELTELTAKLRTFEPFHAKRERLLQERGATLEAFGMEAQTPLARLSHEFEVTEESWNTLTEDLMNADSALYAVSNAVDYLASARNFILVARSQFQVDAWLRTGYLIDLFKHSSLGRAKEMVEGVEHNLRRALMELVCLEDFLIVPADFEHLLLPFLSALFDDLFLHGKLTNTMQLLEQRLTTLEKLKQKLEQSRDAIFARQHKQEENRERLYSKMGNERKKLTLASEL